MLASPGARARDDIALLLARPLPELADVVGLAEAGLAPDLLAESLRGAVPELADASDLVKQRLGTMPADRTGLLLVT